MKKFLKKNDLICPLQKCKGASYFRVISCWFIFVISMLLLSGCAVKPYVPVPGDFYTQEADWAIINTDSLNIFVHPQSYYGVAQNTASSYFTLYVRVKNKSKKNISLNRSSFSILAGNQQFDYIPLEIILGSLQNYSLLRYYQDPFASPIPANYDKYLQDIQQQYLELVNSYFSFGELLPGGSKEGYLFYDKKIEQYNSFELDVWGTKIKFVRK
ncbi:MAG TPA: hypothetical protein PK707_00825 [Candidatus Syntrophosphaera thermopropionivorans]|nr:hypothetical protein [Candidatus Syntrophosphaera thermopropionivorans]